MESLLQEQSEAAKKIPKNVRFNRAYDQTKIVPASNIVETQTSCASNIVETQTITTQKVQTKSYPFT